MTEIILILIGVVGVEGIALYLLNKVKNNKIAKQKIEYDAIVRQNKILMNDAKVKERSIDNMKKHRERINLNEKELEPIKKKVQEASTDEESIEAIADIIRINNSKL